MADILRILFKVGPWWRTDRTLTDAILFWKIRRVAPFKQMLKGIYVIPLTHHADPVFQEQPPCLAPTQSRNSRSLTCAPTLARNPNSDNYTLLTAAPPPSTARQPNELIKISSHPTFRVERHPALSVRVLSTSRPFQSLVQNRLNSFKMKKRGGTPLPPRP